MISRRSGDFYQVKNIINLFVQMGCEIRTAEGALTSADGECFSFRYLLNPSNQAFVPIVDLEDNEYMTSWEVASWERRLGVSIPLPQ